MVQKSEMNFYKNPFKGRPLHTANTQQPPVNKRALTSHSQKNVCRFIQLLTQSIYLRSRNSELGVTAHLRCRRCGCKLVKQDVVINTAAESHLTTCLEVDDANTKTTAEHEANKVQVHFGTTLIIIINTNI